MRTLHVIALVGFVVVACSSFRAGAPRLGPEATVRVRGEVEHPPTKAPRGGVLHNWAETLRLGETTVLTPINTHHLRSVYPPEKIARYTEWPRGMGLGRALLDERGNRREVFGIVFEDSAARLQYNIGYIHIWNWRLLGDDPDLTVGAGYMLFLMGRWDWNYVPMPIVLPLLSIGLARISIESTFVPGSEGLGAVIFTWIQIRL